MSTTALSVEKAAATAAATTARARKGQHIMQDNPLGIRGALIAGAVIIFFFFGVFGTWAALAPLTSAVVAGGVVKVEGNRKTVQHLEGGIISELLVVNGDEVEAGDLLVRLDDTQARASWELVRGQFLALKAQEARLSAEIEGAADIDFPDEIRESFNDPRVQKIMRTQVTLFAARQRKYEGRVQILYQRMEQMKSEISSYQAQSQSASNQLAILSQEIEPLKKLVEKKISPRKSLLELERQAAHLKGVRDQQRGLAARARQLIGETELQIIDLQNELNGEIEDELREINSKLNEANEKLNSSVDVLNRQEVHAPISGSVVELRYFTAGGVIRPGDPIMDIVPRSENLTIEVRIKPNDINSVNIGSEAEVRFTAFKQRTTPSVKGEVIYISADSLSNEEEDESFFLARVEVDKLEMERLGENTVSPGMQAQVMIASGERTLLEYLVDPIRDSVSHAFREE